MRNVFLLVILTVLLSSSISTKDFRIVEHGYGPAKLVGVTKRENKTSPSGNVIGSSGAEFIAKTNKIPAEIGSVLMVEYTLKSYYSNRIDLEKVWVFPDTITSPNGNKYKELRRQITVSTNQKRTHYYMIEDQNELLKGKWEFKLNYEGKNIYQRNFYVE